jgi:hypothetical protein
VADEKTRCWKRQRDDSGYTVQRKNEKNSEMLKVFWFDSRQGMNTCNEVLIVKSWHKISWSEITLRRPFDELGELGDGNLSYIDTDFPVKTQI